MLTFNILSVNVGRPTPISLGDRQIQTGIFKLPRQNGSISVLPSGIEHDSICDTSRHGGPGQAVYLYSAEDAAWWSSQLQREVPAGFFGENITIDRWWPTPRVGDRLVIDQVELEISFPRVPCATLAARVGNPSFPKEFVAANRPGLYTRVIRPGEIRAGMQGSVQRASSDNPTTHALFACWHETPRDRQFLRRALQAPIAERARAAFEYWLGLEEHAPGG
jgi:MOSC domain-containing protein YiiM